MKVSSNSLDDETIRYYLSLTKILYRQLIPILKIFKENVTDKQNFNSF